MQLLKALKLSPNDERARYNLALVYQKQGLVAKAQAELDKLGRPELLDQPDGPS